MEGRCNQVNVYFPEGPDVKILITIPTGNTVGFLSEDFFLFHKL